jgi:hypothetical protein
MSHLDYTLQVAQSFSGNLPAMKISAVIGRKTNCCYKRLLKRPLIRLLFFAS